MYGANYYGQPYYAQGPAVATTFILKSVSATAVTSATISSKLLINKAVSATVVTTASITRQIQRTVSAAITLAASFTSLIILALNVRDTTSKLLNLARVDISLDEDRTTKLIDYDTSTKSITEQN